MCRHTPKKRDFSYRERKGENEERNIFCERERREKSLNFFFRTDRANGKRGRQTLLVCFFGEETQKDEFHRFLERDIPWNIFIIVFKRHFPSTRALRITTHEQREKKRAKHDARNRNHAPL